jgi:hypothetical protein
LDSDSLLKEVTSDAQSSAPDDCHGFIAMSRFTPLDASSRRPRQQRERAHQVVRRRLEGKDPTDEQTTAMVELAKHADRFHQAEGSFDERSASVR